MVKFFIAKRFSEDPKWKKLKVLCSDSHVPGEGEHKILDFIRSMQKSQNGFNLESHCIYGADADLIMLGLSTRI
jgi:5'-3' exonuclease